MARPKTPEPPLSEAVIADIRAQKLNDKQIAEKHNVGRRRVNYYRTTVLKLPGVHSECRRVPKEEEHLTGELSVAELQERWGISRSGVYVVMSRSGAKRSKPVLDRHKAL